jgi:hypothetical protein
MADTATNNPTGVYNLDVTYVNDKLCRYAGEVIHAVSAGLAYTNEFDMARMLGYLADIDAAIAYVTSQPQLDMPESHPLLHSIEPFPEIPNMESDEMDHVARLLKAARTELVNSQSARMGSGFLPFDSRRITALVGKTRQWLTEYVAARSPMDLPETSPQQAMTGAGRGGV